MQQVPIITGMLNSNMTAIFSKLRHINFSKYKQSERLYGYKDR